MVSVQLARTLAQALILMKARALTSDMSLEQVAVAVIVGISGSTRRLVPDERAQISRRRFVASSADRNIWRGLRAGRSVLELLGLA